MTKYLILFGGLIFSLGCTQKKESELAITIVDIEHIDRVGIAKELSIINKHSPRVIGLDFFLINDSLEKDIPLVDELSRTTKIVQVTRLHNNDPFDITTWDSLEQSHPKFRFGTSGFSNLTITDDSILVREMPMRQYHKADIEFAFSYLVAVQYDFDRVNPQYKNGENDFSFDKDSFGRYFKIISVKDLVAGNFDKNDFNDKIVLMGHVSDMEDSFYLDDTRTTRISGVEFQACLIKAILD